MKTYKAILLAVAGLVIVVGAAYFYMKDRTPPVKEPVVITHMKALEGQVTRMFEGENKLVYGLDIPETATSTISMDGALVKIVDNGVPYMAIYMSYEGARGYSSVDYINRVIVPKVNGITLSGTTTIAGIIWTVAQTEMSEWHVGQVGDGQWLMVIESRKALHDDVVETIKSLVAE